MRPQDRRDHLAQAHQKQQQQEALRQGQPAQALDPASIPLPGKGQDQRISIPDDFSGIQFEVERMKRFVQHFSGDRFVRSVAEHVLFACGAAGPLNDAQRRDCAIASIFGWAKANAHFVNDPINKELLKGPSKMISELATPPEVLAGILGPVLTKAIRGEAQIQMAPADFASLNAPPRPS